MASHGTPHRQADRLRWLAACAFLLAGPSFAQNPGNEPPTGVPTAAHALRPLGFDELPGWREDGQAELTPALLATCDRLRELPPETGLGGTGLAGERGGTAALWQRPCAALRPLAAALAREHRPGRRWPRRLRAWHDARSAALRSFLEAHFEPHFAGAGLMTGYYEPVLSGSQAREGAYQTPVYARPPELTETEVPQRRFGVLREGRLEPFHDRAAIQAGALVGRGLEMAWVDDPVAVFFLQIQGSGRIVMPDGRVLRVGYAGQNGHPYVAIGRVLIERGHIPREQVSMQSIRAWLRQAGPERAAEVMAANPSFVFFRRVEDLAPAQGPIGALGVPLTPRRSVAVDRAVIPLGLPIFLVARDPVDGTPMRQTVVAQDTGGAIRGPARTDFFWGWGDAAGERAGLTREDAQVYLLLPRLQDAARARP